jgi:hypothetical protein
MISRSVAKNFKSERRLRLKNFKIEVFKEIKKLTSKMNAGKLSEKDIIKSIDNLRNKFKISFGQAQKPINVILKYHFYLTRKNKDLTKDPMKKVLHCPIDSIILKRLGERSNLKLTAIDKDKYLELQERIEHYCKKKHFNTRIEFDELWDEQHLKDEGILYL